VIDEWMETGTQMQAAIELIEQEKGIVAGIATINIDTNPISQSLQEKYPCHAVCLIWRKKQSNIPPIAVLFWHFQNGRDVITSPAGAWLSRF
jgi:hypothetical protein